MKRTPLAWPSLLLAAACTAGAPPPGAPAVTIGSAAPGPSVPPSSRAVAASPRPTLPDGARDERTYVDKATALRIVEIQTLESLFTATSGSSPDRPRVMRRLAEEYVALARAAERDPGAASERRAQQIAHAARRAAIKYYELLSREYPRWCAVPDAADPTKGRGCADEVLYYLGLEAERDADLDRARHAYLDLLQSWPSSRFVPLAYLAFGELFMAEVPGDGSKLPLAEQSYVEVTKAPLQDNRAWGYAQYRLAQVYILEHDDGRALACLIKATSWATAHADASVGAAARREAVGVFARAGDPAKAREIFAQLASSAEELDEMLAALERLRGR